MLIHVAPSRRTLQFARSFHQPRCPAPDCSCLLQANAPCEPTTAVGQLLGCSLVIHGEPSTPRPSPVPRGLQYCLRSSIIDQRPQTRSERVPGEEPVSNSVTRSYEQILHGAPMRQEMGCQQPPCRAWKGPSTGSCIRQLSLCKALAAFQSPGNREDVADDTLCPEFCDGSIWTRIHHTAQLTRTRPVQNAFMTLLHILHQGPVPLKVFQTQTPTPDILQISLMESCTAS